MANPSGNHQEPSHATSSFNAATNGNSAAPASARESSAAAAASVLKHDPGIDLDWTTDEQAILEDGLAAVSSDSSVLRYAKIAKKLPNKTVRDVAFRCRWMTKKENSKRRKEEHNLSRKSKDKKEKVTDPAKSSQFAARANVPPYAPPMIPIDNDDGIPFRAIGGATGDLLEQNAQVLNQISANIASFQIQDNLNLFCQTRDNILKIMNELLDMPDVMKQMPPLPVKLNEELATTILPTRTGHLMQS